MNLKKYIGIVYKDIVMDEKDGHFQDLPKYIYDVTFHIEKTKIVNIEKRTRELRACFPESKAEK